jgi:hypothetical protein
MSRIHNSGTYRKVPVLYLVPVPYHKLKHVFFEVPQTLPDILLAHEEQGRAELLAENPRQMFRQGFPLLDVRGEVARVAVLHHYVDKLVVPAEVQHVHYELVLQCFQGTATAKENAFFFKLENLHKMSDDMTCKNQYLPGCIPGAEESYLVPKFFLKKWKNIF